MEGAAHEATEDWIKQYTKQCDRKLVAGLNQYARTRGLAISGAGAKFDDLDARELVLDALGDTWMGVVRWDPSKCSLHRRSCISHSRNFSGPRSPDVPEQ